MNVVFRNDKKIGYDAANAAAAFHQLQSHINIGRDLANATDTGEYIRDRKLRCNDLI